MDKLISVLPSSSLLTGTFSKEEVRSEQALLNSERTWVDGALSSKSSAVMVLKVVGIVALYIATGFIAMAIDISNRASETTVLSSLQAKRLKTLGQAGAGVLRMSAVALATYGLSKYFSTSADLHIDIPSDKTLDRIVNKTVMENVFVVDRNATEAPSVTDLSIEEEQAGGLLSSSSTKVLGSVFAAGAFHMISRCFGGGSNVDLTVELSALYKDLTAELSALYKDLPATKPDKSGVTIEQQMAMFAGIEREANSSSPIMTFSNGATLYLGPMAADPPVNNFVVVQGRQRETPQLPHERVDREGMDVHFFDPELNNMDMEIRLSGRHVISEEQAQAIASELMTNLPEAVKSGQIGIKTEDIKLPFSEENLALVLENAIGNQRSIRFYADIAPDQEKPAEGVQQAVQRAINGQFQDANLVGDCVALKDCDSALFAGEKGKQRIQYSIEYIVGKLEAGESVSVFCHQGKDRSAFLVLGALLFMERCKSRKNVEKHTQIVNYLMSKRSIVNDGAYIGPNGEVEERSAQPYLDPVLNAVAEMIDLDNLEITV